MLRSTVALARLGHETEIVSLDRPQDPWVRDLPTPLAAQGQFTRRYGFSSRYLRWVSDHAGEFDVAIMHGIWNFSSVGARRALRRAGTPYAVFTHGMLDPWFRQAFPLKHMLKDVYWALFENRVLRDAACVFFTSEDERKLTRSLYPKATYNDAVVAYGTADAPSDVGRPFANWLPAVMGRPYLLFLSRLHPKKGCDLAIRAFASLAAAHPDLALVMAGPDQVGWASQLRRLAAELGVGERVHWPGMLTGDAKWAAYRGAEAFLLPSHSENFGIVVAEALACGLPVLITDKVNIWREVVAAGAGIVATDDVANVRAMLDRYLNLPMSERTAMKRSARACFTENFDIDRSAANLAARLQGIAKRA
jgi:glycosyltransferase involved in cell wall biosynthesis